MGRTIPSYRFAVVKKEESGTLDKNLIKMKQKCLMK
jgi:hypothetical protein